MFGLKNVDLIWFNLILHHKPMPRLGQSKQPNWLDHASQQVSRIHHLHPNSQVKLEHPRNFGRKVSQLLAWQKNICLTFYPFFDANKGQELMAAGQPTHHLHMVSPENWEKLAHPCSLLSSLRYSSNHMQLCDDGIRIISLLGWYGRLLGHQRFQPALTPSAFKKCNALQHWISQKTGSWSLHWLSIKTFVGEFKTHTHTHVYIYIYNGNHRLLDQVTCYLTTSL